MIDISQSFFACPSASTDLRPEIYIIDIKDTRFDEFRRNYFMAKCIIGSGSMKPSTIDESEIIAALEKPYGDITEAPIISPVLQDGNNAP